MTLQVEAETEDLFEKNNTRKLAIQKNLYTFVFSWYKTIQRNPLN